MKRIVQFLVILGSFSSMPSGEAFAQGRGYGMGPGMMGWGYGGYGMGWFGMIFMAIFWIALLVGVILLIRWLWVSTGKKERGASEDSPLEILKRRYARGEINKQEFDEKRQDLG